MILIVVLYALLASTFIFAKKAILYANPCFLISFRMIIAGIILLGYQIFWGKKFELPTIAPEDYWPFFKTSLFHIYLAFILEFWALQYVSSLKTAMIYSSTPFIAALLSYFLLQERLSCYKIIGILIGILGLAPVIMASATGAEAYMELGYISLPEIVLFCSVISAAYAWFLVKNLMTKGYQLGLINGVAMLIGGILSLLTAAIFEGFSHPVLHWGYFLTWVFALILVANIMVYNLYGTLLRTYSITFITFAGFLSPCFSAIYEWLFFGGVITWHYIVSILLVTIGLFIFYQNDI